MSRARIEAILEASPFRQPAPCPYFGACGGCDYQHISYAHQLAIKQGQVKQVLARIGGITDAPINPIIPSPKTFGYRNRITVHTDRGAIGYFARESRTVIDVEACPIASPAVNALLKQLRERAPKPGRHHALRENAYQTTFSQTNDEVAMLLQGYVVQMVGSGVVIDAYAGDGFFAHELARKVTRVIGIDWNRPAIERARRFAQTNERYEAADVAAVLPELLSAEHPEAVILDPSREGPAKGVIEALVARPPSRLIYISCNPPALARDLKHLLAAFGLRELQPFDMFPQTAEIEVAAVLDRKT
jgi:tRNA/tmRNA/rRNA uracil-C5-methylase (TrmA/RlmC/RlmD family)